MLALCGSPECRALERHLAGQKGNRKRWEGWTRPKRKTCVMCGKTKPLNRRYFTPSHRAPDGTIAQYDSYCKPCRAAQKRDQYHSDPAARADALRRAALQRQRLMERAEHDPGVLDRHREQKRAWDRARVERRRAGVDDQSRPEPRNHIEYAPSAPLARALDELAANWAVGNDEDGRVEAGTTVVCAITELSERQLYRWRVGEMPEVTDDAADRILTRLGLAWWEVWTEETVRLPVVRAVTYRRYVRAMRDGRLESYRRRIQTYNYGDRGPDRAGIAAARRAFEGRLETDPADPPRTPKLCACGLPIKLDGLDSGYALDVRLTD